MQITFDGLTLEDLVSDVADFLESTGFNVTAKAPAAPSDTPEPDTKVKTTALAPPPSPAPLGDEVSEVVDSAGYPWHTSIHTRNRSTKERSTNSDGTWRNKRGSKPEEVENVRAADRANGYGTPPPAATPPAATPPTPPTPPAAAAPANSPEVAQCVELGSLLMERAMAMKTDQTAEGDWSVRMGEFFGQAMAENGLAVTDDLIANPEKAPGFLVSLQAIAAQWEIPC